MEFKGRIHKILETQQISATFQKRDIVIESSATKGDRTYTELVTFQFVQDKVDLLNSFEIGQDVEIIFNIKGRCWVSPQNEEKFFNTLQAFVINVAANAEEPVLPPVRPPVLPPVTYDNELEENVPF